MNLLVREESGDARYSVREITHAEVEAEERIEGIGKTSGLFRSP